MTPRVTPYLMRSVGKSLLRMTGEILPNDFSALDLVQIEG